MDRILRTYPDAAETQFLMCLIEYPPWRYSVFVAS